MRKILRSFELILLSFALLFPVSVFADDFEDDFIENAEFYEQAYETDNKSDAYLRGINEDPQEDNITEDQSSEPTVEEDLNKDPDPSPLPVNMQDPDPEEDSKESDSKAGDSGETDSTRADEVSPDYTEDLKDITNMLQNLQLTIMIVCGIIIGFFFITRLLP